MSNEIEKLPPTVDIAGLARLLHTADLGQDLLLANKKQDEK